MGFFGYYSTLLILLANQFLNNYPEITMVFKKSLEIPKVVIIIRKSKKE